MPDVFDQIHAGNAPMATGTTPPPTGDIFSQIHAAGGKLPEAPDDRAELAENTGAIPQHTAAELAPGQASAAAHGIESRQQEAHLNALESARQRQASQEQWGAEHPILNAGKQFTNTAVNFLGNSMAELANRTPGTKQLTPDQMAHVRQQMAMKGGDPNSLSGEVGSMAATLPPILMAGPAAPAVMLGQGAVNREGEIENAVAGGAQLTPEQISQYRRRGNMLDFSVGALLPGGRASGAAMEALGVNALNGLARPAARFALGGAAAGLEGQGYQALQNINASSSGVDPDRPVEQGVGRAGLQMALLGGGMNALHGGAPAPRPETPAPGSTEAAPSVAPELRGSVAGYVDRLAQATDPNNPQNAFKRAAAMQAAKGGASESIPDPSVLEKGNHGFENAEGQPVDPNPVEVKPVEEAAAPQRRAADNDFADATFQSPEQAAPGTIHALDKYQPKSPPSAAPPPETWGPSPNIDLRGFLEAQRGEAAKSDLSDFLAAQRKVQNVRPQSVEAKAAAAESNGPTVFQKSAGEQAVAEEYGKPAATPKAVEALKVAEPTPALLPPEAKTPEATPAATPEAAPEGETFFQKLVREGAAQAKRLASEEEGGTSAATVFAQKTVIPTARAAADAFVGAARGLRRMFGGQSGTPAEATKEIFKERGGKLARYADQVNDQLDNMEKAVNRLPVDQQRAITDNAELGQPQPDKNFQQAADTMQVMYKDQLAEMQARDPRFQGIENYMGHMYENADPQKTATLISEHMSQRPLAGKGDFKNERIFPLQADAVKAGLEPVNNPVTVAKAKLKAMAQWIHTFDAKAHMDAAGMLKDVPENGKIPEGMATVSDPMFRGKMMPEEAASVLQNATSRGIMGDPNFGPALRGLRTVANTVNQSSLGLSAFHATGSAINSAVSEFALGLEHLAPAVGFKGTFRPVEGLTKLANGTTMLGPAIRDYMLGKKGQAEWLKPGSTDPQTKLLMDAMEGEGGRALTTADYQTQATEKMMKAFREGNPLAGILRAPLAGLEQLAKPIMEKLVPRLKIGAYMQMGRQALLDHPNATAEELPGLMNKAWESVDNRFGQLVHDNRFWNQTTKQIAQMSMRSLGWNLGSLHEATGAAVDTAKALKDAVSGTQPQLTHKMSYAAALPTLVGIAGAVIHCGLHGTAPTNLADLYHVPTGEKDADGHDVKINLPTYMKDVASVGHDPMGTVANKLHPLIGSTVELMRNKDYYGNKVYQEDDTAVQAMKDVAKHYGEAAVPLSIRQLMQAHEEEQSAGSQIARFAGVTQSPKYLSQSAAEQAALAPVQARSQAQEGRTTAAQLKNDLTSAVRNKAPDAQERIDAAVKAGDITAQDVPKIRQNATKPHNLTTALGNPAVSADYMMTHVLPKMTQEEARTNQMVMIRRLNAADITPAKKQQYRAALSAAVKGQ